MDKIKRNIGIVLGLLGVAGGLLAIFKLVTDIEIAVGFVTISFGILAIIWTTMAIISLSRGSALRKHTQLYLLCLIFVLLFSVWHTLSKIYDWRETINEAMLYPGYVFISMAFIIFVVTSYQVLTMGKEFGFGNQSKKIVTVMQERKRRK